MPLAQLAFDEPRQVPADATDMEVACRGHSPRLWRQWRGISAAGATNQVGAQRVSPLIFEAGNQQFFRMVSEIRDACTELDTINTLSAPPAPARSADIPDLRWDADVPRVSAAYTSVPQREAHDIGQLATTQWLAVLGLGAYQCTSTASGIATAGVYYHLRSDRADDRPWITMPRPVEPLTLDGWDTEIGSCDRALRSRTPHTLIMGARIDSVSKYWRHIGTPRRLARPAKRDGLATAAHAHLTTRMDLYYEIHETIRRGWSWERIGGDLGVSADRAAE